VLEVETGAAEAARQTLVDVMQAAAELVVPLKVDARAGANWDEAH
jgi:DNA polymerase-1